MQLVVHNGHDVAVLFRFGKKLVNGAESKFNVVKCLSMFQEPFDRCFRRSATVVAQAIKHHRVAKCWIGSFYGKVDLSVKIVSACHVAGRDAVANHFCTTGSKPPECLRRQTHLIFVRSMEYIAAVSKFMQQIR